MRITISTKAPSARNRIFPLENGQRLRATEFLERYESKPELNKAELIDGKVWVMPNPVRALFHGDQHMTMNGWLGSYDVETPCAQGSSRPTLKLNDLNVPQPDSVLRLLPEAGGRTHVDDDDFLNGPPELIAEIAASIKSLELHDKLIAYQKAGIPEYIVWCTEDENFLWFVLKNGKYSEMMPDKDSIYRSRIFPGLWLDIDALFRDDMKRVIAVLKKGLKSPEHAKFVKRLSHS